MKKPLMIIHELAISLGVATCIGGWASNNAILHGPNPANMVQPFAAAIIWWVPSLIGTWILEAFIVKSSEFFGIDSDRWKAARTLFPLYFCFLAVLQPVFTYFAYGPCLLTLLLTGILYRHWRRIQQCDNYKERRLELEEKLNTLDHKWIACSLSLVFLLFYILIASATFADLPEPEGDEPHYLVATYSMLTDGDIELLNNYKKNDYALWHTGYIQPHTKAGVEGISQQFPMHNVGLSAYLIPFMAVGLAFGGKAAFLWWIRFGMILLAAALVAALYYLLATRFCGRITAIIVVALTGLTSPILFYSYHVFTEIPVLLLLVLCLQKLLAEKTPSVMSRIFLGLSLGAMPWLGIKYLTLAAAFVVFWIIREFMWGFRPQKALFVAIPGAILGIWFFITTYALFGTFNPAAYQFGAEVDMFSRNSVIRISEANDIFDTFRLTGEALLAYLIGQHQGLFFYAPWLLLGIAGLWRMISRGGEVRKTAMKLLLLALPFIIIYGITGLGGGHSPPGRTMVPILWLFILPAGWILQDGLVRGREIFAAAIFVSVSIALALLRNPAFLYHDFHVPASKLLSWLSTPFVNLVDILPSLFNRHMVNWPVSALWAFAIIVAIWIWTRKEKSAASRNIPIGSWTWVFLAFLLLYAFFGKTPPLLANHFEDKNIQIYFKDGNVFLDPTGFWVITQTNEVIYLVCNQDVNSLEFRLRSVTPNKAIIRSGGLQHEIELLDRKIRPISISLSNGFIVDSRRVLRMSIESLSGNPEGLALPSGDKRPLGVEVTIPK